MPVASRVKRKVVIASSAVTHPAEFGRNFTFVPAKVSRRFSLLGSVMFRRRTATVMSSLPEARVASFVISKESYFPLPTIRREPSSYFPIFSVLFIFFPSF